MTSRLYSLPIAAVLALVTVACGSGSMAPTAPSILRSGDIGSPSSSAPTTDTKHDDANDNNAANEVEFTGAITSLSPLMVAGRMVSTNSSTQLMGRDSKSVTFAAFKVGDMVEVDGTSNADGSVLAEKIKLEDANENEVENQVEFVGSISSLSPLVVAGRTVTTNSSTRFSDRDNKSATLASFKVGDMVEVEGVSQTDGSVLATKIKRDN